MNPLLQRFYQASPVFLQHCMVTAYGWHLHRRRFGRIFWEELPRIREREAWSADELEAYQCVELTKLLQAAAKIPHYQQAFAEAGVRIEEIRTLADLRRVPFLEKDTLRAKAAELVVPGASRSNVELYHTSGTSGKPTDIFYDPRTDQLTYAYYERRARGWAGVSHRDSRVMFGVRKVAQFDQVRPPFWRYNAIERQYYMSIYHLSPDLLGYYVDFLNDFQPGAVVGYPSALHSVARFVLDKGLSLTPAKAVLTSSETLLTTQREDLERAFGCRVFDAYSGVETCALASECEHGRMHISPEVGIVELLDRKGRPVPAGQPGEIVCTGLLNHYQPLVRYRVGDVATWSDEVCACGRQMTILCNIEGRVEDVVVLPDGREMTRFDAAFKGVSGLVEAQVVQEAIDRIVVRLVVKPEFSDADEAVLVRAMREHVGNVELEMRREPRIERTPGGKFRAVVSKLKRPAAA
jgi:phenylacetate-CoA ligase